MRRCGKPPAPSVFPGKICKLKRKLKLCKFKHRTFSNWPLPVNISAVVYLVLFADCDTYLYLPEPGAFLQAHCL